MEAVLSSVLDSISKAKVYDLAQTLQVGMPNWPTHPPFFMSPYRRHGDLNLGCGYSSSNEVIILSGHSGTHMDALGHVSEHGCIHGGSEATTAVTHKGLKAHGIDEASPLVGRGVLLDIPALRGTSALNPAEPVSGDDLQEAARRQGVRLQAEDIVLVRTGWGAFWNDPGRFLHAEGQPGPDISAGQFLAAMGVKATGSDTLAYEVTPHPIPSLPVHMLLLTRHGIHILENLNLEQLAAERVYEFLFIAAPLKVVGGSGSPIRPIALV